MTPGTQNHSLQQDTRVATEILSVHDKGFLRLKNKGRKTTWIGFGIFVLISGHHLSSTTDFTRQHARNPSIPANLPNPLYFTPPNGRDWEK